MPRKGRKRKAGVPRKKRVRDEVAVKWAYLRPKMSLWPHEIEVKVGDYLEVISFRDADPLHGAVVAYTDELLTIDRGEELGRIQVKAPWCLRKVGLLERIALEVADAERADD